MSKSLIGASHPIWYNKVHSCLTLYNERERQISRRGIKLCLNAMVCNIKGHDLHLEEKNNRNNDTTTGTKIKLQSLSENSL